MTLYRRYSGLNCRLKSTFAHFFVLVSLLLLLLQRICYLIFHLSIIWCQKMHFTPSPRFTLMFMYCACAAFSITFIINLLWFTLSSMFYVATHRLADTVSYRQRREINEWISCQHMANRNYSRINRSIHRCHRSFTQFPYVANICTPHLSFDAIFVPMFTSCFPRWI